MTLLTIALVASVGLNAALITGIVTLESNELPNDVSELHILINDLRAETAQAVERANTAEDQLSEVQSGLEDYIDTFGDINADDEEEN